MNHKKTSPAPTASKLRASGAHRTLVAAPRTSVPIFTLAVSLLRAPGAREGSGVLRTIQIRGDQTLADLHRIVCAAFCRESEQLYEFQLGREPLDPEGPRYVLAGAYEVSVADGTPAAGRVDRTPLNALGLEVGDRFAYWIDCGDDWWHRIDVQKIEDKVPRGTYPKITKRVGDNPPPGTKSAAADETGSHPLAVSEAADAAYLVGEMHLSKGAYRKAVEAFTRSIEDSPSADAFEGRARAYRGLADEDERTAAGLK